MLADLSVSRKLTAAFAAALIALLCMCAATVTLQTASIRSARENASSYKVVGAVERAISGLYDQNASIRGLVLYKQPRYVQKYTDAGKLLADALKEATGNARGQPALLVDLDQLAQATHGWQAGIGEQVVSLAGAEA
ncbi:MAG: CHASE3 domain-containing protein, partial [Caulobacteraceae bacterium]